MGRFVRKAMSIILLFVMINSVVLTSYAENVVNEEMILESTSISEEVTESEEGEIVETIKLDFIEETSSGQSINEYESEIKKKIDDIILNNEIELIEGIETTETSAKDTTSALESAISKIVNNKLEENDIIEASSSEINDEEFLIVATMNEVEELIFVEDNLFGTSLFGSGNHTSTASPSVVINSTYDRYEIYTGENEGVVRIFDNNGEYYNSDTNVKVIRDMADSNNNSPILLRLETNVSLFNFDNSNDNYVLLPEGFVEDLVARYSGNGYLNPQGINNLDHIRVDVIFNTSNLGNYDLFEYGVLYYLSCYEGVLGEYYYYDPSTTDIDRAASFYVNNKIMNRTYNIVSEYFYKSPSGEQLSFKPTWVLNSDSLIGANKETYAKQWVNFPYFLIKTGEKYWNLRESIEQSTYLSEYAEGYYEQYLTESPYGNVAERLVVLDDIYKTETDLLNDNTSNVAVHPYVKSNAIEITGNFREDNINDADKLRAGGVLPFDTYTVLNLNVTDHRAKSVQVYLNGEKLISNNNHGLYTLTNGKCQLRIDGSKLLSDENSRNVLSFILLNEEGNYLTDAQGRIINSYISLIRSSSINKETHRVHFVVNGGNNIPDINIEEGNRLGLPTNPVKEHYTFVAWYKDSNFTVRFDEKGDILVGYYFENDKVYYLDNGEKNKANIGKMLTGWHWLPSFDGGYCCYYFEVDGENKGVLVTDKETNDGYRVDVFGRWCDSGQVQRRNYN